MTASRKAAEALRTIPVWLGVAAVVLALAGLYQPAAAQTGDTPSMRVSVGLDGLCKWESWTPINIVLENRGASFVGDIEVISESTIGLPSSKSYAMPVTIPSVARKTYRLDVYLPVPVQTLETRLVSEGGEVVAESSHNVSCLAESAHIVGVVADEPTVYNSLRSVGPSNRDTRVAFLEIKDLPESALSLNPLGTLLFAGVDTNLIRPSQREAVESWVAAGGQLVLVGGPSWRETTSGFTDLLPLSPQGLVPLDGLEPGSASAAGQGARALVTGGSPREGAKTLLEQGGHALLTARDVGAGAVLFLAADPSLEPFRSWEHRDLLFGKLTASPSGGQARSMGIQDWRGAAAAAEMIPDVGGVPIPLLCSSILLYIVIIGPVNFIVLRKLKRRELAWFTIPLLVIAFSGLSFMFGSRVRGDRPILNHLSVLHVIPGAEKAQVDSVVGVFSPQRTKLDLKASGPIHARGLDDRNWSAVISPDSIVFPAVQFDVGGVRKVALEGEVEAPRFEHELTVELTSDLSVRGWVRNASSLALHDAVFLTPFGSQPIGDIRPASTVNLDLDSSTLTNVLGATTYCDLTSLLAIPTYGPDVASVRMASFTSSLRRNRFDRQGCIEGIYIAGWADERPFDLQIEGHSTRDETLTLYFIELEPRVLTPEGQTSIPPSMMRWGVLESSSSVGNPSTYDVMLSQGAFSLSFFPIYPVSYSSVTELGLYFSVEDPGHLRHLNISLWDFREQTWVRNSGLRSGMNQIDEPGRFVSNGGEVRLRMENPGSEPMIFIDTIEISLTLQS